MLIAMTRRVAYKLRGCVPCTTTSTEIYPTIKVVHFRSSIKVLSQAINAKVSKLFVARSIITMIFRRLCLSMKLKHSWINLEVGVGNLVKLSGGKETLKVMANLQ
jgi:hypothetical protein